MSVLPARWEGGAWAPAQAVAGSASSRPAACGSGSGVVSEVPEGPGSTHTPTPTPTGSPTPLTSLCSLRSSSLKLLLTFMSCCTFASEVARAFFSSRYSCSVTAPSDRSEESMLCEVRQKPLSRRGQGRRAALHAVTSPLVPKALDNKRMELGPDGGREGLGGARRGREGLRSDPSPVVPCGTGAAQRLLVGVLVRGHAVVVVLVVEVTLAPHRQLEVV